MRTAITRGAAAALLGLACAACGSSGSQHRHTSTAARPAGSPSAQGTATTSAPSGSARATAATAIAALRSVPDTAAFRTEIVIGDLDAMWRAAGIPPRPTVRQASGRAGTDATIQELGGAAGGAELRNVVTQTPDPLGYPALSVDAELSVGQPPGALGEVWGPIDHDAVLSALKPLKLPAPVTAGASSVQDLGATVNPNRPAPFDTILLGTRYLVVPVAGGRLVTAGDEAGEQSATTLAAGTGVSDPLSSDPTVAPLLQAFGSHVQSLALGTGLVTPIGEVTRRLSPAAQAKFAASTGVRRLPAAPVIAGFAYTGGSPQAETVTAAVLYPSAPDAEAAVTSVVGDTTSGTSVVADMPYRRLWHVDSTTENGPLVIMQLTTRSAGAITKAVQEDDFPLFWAP